MGRVLIGLNAEYSRSSDKPFEWAVEEAAKMGYTWFEPMVHFGRELMSEAGYFHTVSMFDDPFRIKEACDGAGLKISGLQSHGPLGRPDVHGEYIKLAIHTAAETRRSSVQIRMQFWGIFAARLLQHAHPDHERRKACLFSALACRLSLVFRVSDLVLT